MSVTVNASNMHFQKLNEMIKKADGDVIIDNCLGQRFIAGGQSGKRVTINGVPGNALGSYLNGSEIIVNGNAQDATGDTMNCGRIIIHGSTGDAAGYAMRGGEIYIRDNAGYRAGIHMKAYADKLPVMVIGGKCGSFLGEYQAGGLIIVLGLNCNGDVVSNFCGMGMHGGKIFLRSDCLNVKLPNQVNVRTAVNEDIEEIRPYIENFSTLFRVDEKNIFNKNFFVLTPNTQNPYKQLYVQN